ncbi:GTPase Era [Amylibacter sp. SFDW26]|uniref:GTPase Era n=1 Tax=Amylibacter sp. SFDW26 TaxID=2652722 RepID=UPI001261C540|nr:GTPase Era [Amylibacter sp. SFDW26]KAB7614812.1 GTPase Era [Amylibacter sp. SFDW26]
MTDTRCGYVSLIGEPNAGKSTLMNHLVGAKVSIVTHKVQTTRARIRGIAMEDNAQLVFVDTPGLFQTRRNLDKAMVAAAWSGANDGDIVVLMIEAHRGITPGVEMILDGLEGRIHKKQRVILAINKIDMVKSEKLLALTKEMNDKYPFEETFMVSAEKGFGIKELRAYFAKNVPEGPWLYPEDQIADVPLRLIAAETTREKLMLRLHQELPYFLTVETVGWEQKKDGSVRIDQVVYVIRERHKGIALGPKGQTMKAVSIASRTELKNLVGSEVHLFIQVKVRPKWENEAERFTEMGLDFSDTRK